MPENDFDFHAAMRQMGVRRLEESTETKKARAPKKSKPAATPRPKTAAPARTMGGPPSSSRPAAPSARSSRTPKPRAPAPPPQAPPSTEHLETALATARARIDALTAKLSASQQEAEAAASRADELAADLRDRDAAASRLSRQLEDLQTGQPAAVMDTLRDRGVWGEAEARQLMAELDTSGRFAELLAGLSPRDPEAFAEWLQEASVLLGDCGACPDSGSRAVLRVPRSRCEVCGGSDIRRVGRRLVDRCLANGILRITIVGGSPKYHRQLRELIQHHRIKLRMVPGRSRRTTRQARDDLRGSDVVVIWAPTLLTHSMSDLYTSQSDEGRIVLIPHRGIATMLQALTEQLGSVRA